MLLPETKMEHAKIIAERLRENVCNAPRGEFEGRELPQITISLGVTEYKPNYTLETMIASADVAMYKAKQNGRNCVEIATDN